MKNKYHKENPLTVQLKKQAKKLLSILKARVPSISYSVCLEICARLKGAKNWYTYRTKLAVTTKDHDMGTLDQAMSVVEMEREAKKLYSILKQYIPSISSSDCLEYCARLHGSKPNPMGYHIIRAALQGHIIRAALQGHRSIDTMFNYYSDNNVKQQTNYKAIAVVQSAFMQKIKAYNHTDKYNPTDKLTLDKQTTTNEYDVAIERILSEAFKKVDYDSWFLCFFLFNSKLRVSEALGCHVNDLNSKDRTLAVKVQRPAQSNRLKYIKNETLITEIEKWVKRYDLKPNDSLFNFNSHTAHKKVNRAFKLAGIHDENAGAHILRLYHLMHMK